MDSALYLLFAILYAALFAYGMTVWAKDSARGFRYLLLLVTAALLWDNGVLGAGRWIGEGDWLERLNRTRYWLHAFVTPLLAVVSLDLMRRAGSPWARKPAAMGAAWLFAAALIVLEVATVTWSVKLKPVYEYGALRYASAGTSPEIPFMVVLVMIPLLAAGAVLWKRHVTSALFWGTIVMGAGSAIRLPVRSSAVANLFELVLIGALWLSVASLRNRRPAKAS